MYHIYLLLSIILGVSSNIVKFNTLHDDDWLSDNYDLSYDSNKRLAAVDKRPLRVLSLRDGVSNPKIRLGTDEEVVHFNEFIGPYIKRRVKKDNPFNPPLPSERIEDEVQEELWDENTNLQAEVMKIINKFDFSTSVEPDSYLSEANEEYNQSVDLYFKDDYTSLVVKSGSKVWQYFVQPPSPLPAWFYEIHDHDSDDMEVPEDVKNDFFHSLLQLLHKFFAYPV